MLFLPVCSDRPLLPWLRAPRSSLHCDLGRVPALRPSGRELPATTAPKAKRHQPHKGVAAGDGRWNKRRGTKGKNNRGKRNPETVKRKAEEKRQLEEYADYLERNVSPSPVPTEVPSDNEQQLTQLRVKAEKREKKEEPEEEDRREHGVRDVEFEDQPQSSNPKAASSRKVIFTQYIPSQEERATTKWEEVYLAKRRRVKPERK